MKVEQVEAIFAHNWLFFEVTTDTGLTGLGEAGLWAYPPAAAAMLDYLRLYLVGQNPLAIEHHWQYLYRSSHFRGASVSAALAAIDVALWDIAGKHLGVPIYQLFGGPTRDRVRLYLHVNGDTPELLACDAKRAVAEGFTAVRFDAFRPAWPAATQNAVLACAVERTAAVREAVGPDVDLCVECHWKFTPAEALDIGRALEPFRLLFLEDPIPPESLALMGDLARRLPVAIGTGERLNSLEEFRDLLLAGPVAYVRPDVGLTGLTQARKIAALAEAWRIGVIPHNWLSPVTTAAAIHLDASISGFVLQEFTGEDQPPKTALVNRTIRRDGGYLVLPETPGLGVELNHAAIASMPFTPRAPSLPLRPDGSVVDN
jgi:galactonate dehydratase